MPILYRSRAWAVARWPRSPALLVVVGAIGALVLTLAAGTLRTATAADRYERSWGARDDVAIEQADGSPRLSEIAELPAVASVRMATFVFGGLVRPTGPSIDSFLFIGDSDALGQRVVEGAAPRRGSSDELLISRSLAESTHLGVGDHVSVVTIKAATAAASGFDITEPDGPTIDATVVGVVEGPAALAGDSGPLALLPQAALGRGDIGVAATEGVIDLRPGATLRDLRTQLDRLPSASDFHVEPAVVVPTDVRDAVATQAQGLLVLLVVVAVSTLVVLGQLLTRQLRVGDDERAILRALGYTPRQLLREQAARAGAVAAAGAVVAVGAAFLASATFPAGLAKSVEPFPGRRFDVLALLGGAGVLTLVATTWVVIAAAASSTDRAEAGPVGRPSVIDRVVPSLPGWRVSTALRFAFAPAPGSTGAGRLPLLGLTLVATILTGALTFGANLDRTVTEPASWGEGFDIGLGQGEDQIDPQVVAALSASGDVTGLTLFGSTTLQIGTESLNVVGMRQVKGDVVPEVVAGRLPRGAEEVALGPRASEVLHASVGDRITGVAERGGRSLTVTGIAIIPGIEGADVLGRNALVTAAGFHHLDAGRGFSSAGLDIADRPGSSAKVGAILGVSPEDGLGGFSLPAQILALRRVQGIPGIVAAAVGALVVLSLGHLMLVAVRRRRRDFAVLRVVGATQRRLDGVVHWQATLSTAVVLLVAGPVGALAGASLFRRFVDHLGARPGAAVPVVRIAVVLLALVVLSNAVAAVAARRLRRERTIEALRPT